MFLLSWVAGSTETCGPLTSELPQKWPSSENTKCCTKKVSLGLGPYAEMFWCLDCLGELPELLKQELHPNKPYQELIKLLELLPAPRGRMWLATEHKDLRLFNFFMLGKSLVIIGNCQYSSGPSHHFLICVLDSVGFVLLASTTVALLFRAGG